LLLASGAKVLYPGHGSIVTVADILPVFRRRAARTARRELRLTAATAQAQA